MNRRDEGIFYGWYVVAALFFATFLVVGTRQGFGVFVETWEREFAVSVSTVSIAASVGWLLNGFSQPVLGQLVDRFGGRPIAIISLFVMGVAFMAMALVGNVYVLIGLWGFVVSFAAGGVSPGVTGVFVARWFERRRGTAMSVLVTGGSAGGLLLIPFLAQLLQWTDWRTAWFTIGVMVLGLGLPLVWLVTRSDPSELGLLPDGESAEPGQETGGRRWKLPIGPLNVDRWQQSFRSPPMWQLSIAYWVCGVTTASIAVHYVRWASSEGISPGTAAMAFGVLSGINAASVLLVGGFSDRLQRKYLLGAVYLVRSVAFLALIFLPGPAALWAFAVIGGASWLATVPLTTSLAADVYGIRHLGMLAGLINMAHQVGGALAAYLFGVVFDVWGSYDIAYAAGAILLVVAGITALTIREKRYSARYSPVAPAVAPATAGLEGD